MTEATVGTDFHEPLDVHGDFLAEIAFDAMLLFNDLANMVDLVVVQFANLGVETDAGRGQNLAGLRAPDAIDIGKGDFDSLIRRKIHAGDTRHLRNPPVANYS